MGRVAINSFTDSSKSKRRQSAKHERRDEIKHLADSLDDAMKQSCPMFKGAERNEKNKLTMRDERRLPLMDIDGHN